MQFSIFLLFKVEFESMAKALHDLIDNEHRKLLIFEENRCDHRINVG